MHFNLRKKAIAKAEQNLPPQHFRECTIRRTRKQLSSLSAYYGLGTHMTGEAPQNENAQASNVRTFIVHGHDRQSLFELKDYLQNTLRLDEPVVLQQMPGQGEP
jgi:predicted nucleotide-binding protein